MSSILVQWDHCLSLQPWKPSDPSPTDTPHTPHLVVIYCGSRGCCEPLRHEGHFQIGTIGEASCPCLGMASQLMLDSTRFRTLHPTWCAHLRVAFAIGFSVATVWKPPMLPDAMHRKLSRGGSMAHGISNVCFWVITLVCLAWCLGGTCEVFVDCCVLILSSRS